MKGKVSEKVLKEGWSLMRGPTIELKIESAHSNAQVDVAGRDPSTMIRGPHLAEVVS